MAAVMLQRGKLLQENFMQRMTCIFLLFSATATVVISQISFDTESLKDAVELWCKNEPLASDTYGDISTWNTSRVTEMEFLFSKYDKYYQENPLCVTYYTFNGDISRWNRTLSHQFPTSFSYFFKS